MDPPPHSSQICSQLSGPQPENHVQSGQSILYTKFSFTCFNFYFTGEIKKQEEVVEKIKTKTKQKLNKCDKNGNIMSLENYNNLNDESDINTKLFNVTNVIIQPKTNHI